MTTPINPDDYVFTLTAPPPRTPYLIVTVGDRDEDGYSVSIPIHERPDLGSPMGECIALLPRGTQPGQAQQDMLNAIAIMADELARIDEPVRMAEHIEDSMSLPVPTDQYALAWAPAQYDPDGERYTMPDRELITDADEVRVLRGFMKLVAAHLRTSAQPTSNPDSPESTTKES